VTDEVIWAVIIGHRVHRTTLELDQNHLRKTGTSPAGWPYQPVALVFGGILEILLVARAGPDFVSLAGSQHIQSLHLFPLLTGNEPCVNQFNFEPWVNVTLIAVFSVLLWLPTIDTFFHVDYTPAHQ